MNKNRTVIVVTGILAMFQFLAGAAMLADYIGDKPAGIFVLLVGAVQAGWAIIQQALVVPVGDVAAYVDNSGQVVAGNAAGATNGTPVMVEPGTLLHGEVGTALPPQNDLGRTTGDTILIVCAIIVAIAAAVWLLARLL
jgi:hypothetical protein